MDDLLPLLFVMLGWVFLPRGWRDRPRSRAVIERVLVVILALLLLRYLGWRLTVTVLPARGLSVETLLVWSVFLIELISWLDVTVLLMALLRRTDRSPEADRHEARLRAQLPGTLPMVDVFIATYDEPAEVLEKTVTGALALDWPRERLRIHVLDDGRRDWLAGFCARLGVIHMTREDNRHAKAGNINAALRRTSGELFLVLDADFVPQQNFLYRTAGFFEDPKIGIVQVPHNFFNADPMQSNLRLTKALPDDQRLFFDAIMPGRDGWDCAFCCGSNALTRRAAIDAVGGGLPTGSITEDMLLTLVMLRKGYVTRYLNERLAIGLAAESLRAFFIQRSRWARGAMQILYLRDGPLGPGLRLPQRLLFLPTHWLTQSLAQITAVVAVPLYLWTGLLPILNCTVEGVVGVQLPAILGTIVTLRLLAPQEYHPLAATAHALLQAFRLLPTVLVTLVKPQGHAFRVTPKGRAAADGSSADGFTVTMALGLVMLTGGGLWLNTDFDMRVLSGNAMMTVVAGWSVWNMIVLTLVAAIAISPPMRRVEERFPLNETVRVTGRLGVFAARISDISLSGVRLIAEPGQPTVLPERGDWVLVELARVGRIPALIHRHKGPELAGEFMILERDLRLALVRRLFTEGIDNSTHAGSETGMTLALLRSILRRSDTQRNDPPLVVMPPDWLIEAMEDVEDHSWRDVMGGESPHPERGATGRA